MYNFPFLNRIVRVNDDRSSRSHTRAVYDYYKDVAEVARQDFDTYVKAGKTDKVSEVMDSPEWQIYLLYMQTEPVIKALNKALKIETDKQARSEIMSQQNELRKEMLKNIRQEGIDCK